MAPLYFQLCFPCIYCNVIFICIACLCYIWSYTFRKYLPPFILVRVSIRIWELDFLLSSCSLSSFCSLQHPCQPKWHPSQTKLIWISAVLLDCIHKTTFEELWAQLYHLNHMGTDLKTSQVAIFIVYSQSRTTFFQITNVFSFANQSLKARDRKPEPIEYRSFSGNWQLPPAMVICMQCHALRRLDGSASTLPSAGHCALMLGTGL